MAQSPLRDKHMQRSSQAPASEPREQRWYPRRVIGATLVVMLVAAGFYLLYLFSNVLFVLFVAVVLATAIRPGVLWLERRGIPQWLGTLLMFALIVILAVGVLALIAPLLIAQVATLSADLPQYYQQLREWLVSVRIPILRNLFQRLPAEFQWSATGITADPEQVSAAAQAAAYVRATGWALFSSIAITLITFFWIIDREQIVRAGLLLFPIERRDAAREIWDTLEFKVGAFVRGQALLCLSIGIASTLAFVLIGVPNAVLLGVIAGILELIPYIGPILTGILAVAVTLAQSPEKIWWVLGAFILIQQLENAVLVPRIMDQTVGVNAVVVLLAIAAFGTLLGVGGAIMAIPLAVMIQVLVERLLLNAPAQPAEISGRDQFARLRYEAQDLASDIRGRLRDHDDDTATSLVEEDIEALVGELDELLQSMGAPAAESGAATAM